MVAVQALTAKRLLSLVPHDEGTWTMMPKKPSRWERISPVDAPFGTLLCHRALIKGRASITSLAVGKIDVVVHGAVARQTVGYKMLVDGEEYKALGTALTKRQAEKQYMHLLRELCCPKRPRRPKPVQLRLELGDPDGEPQPRARRPKVVLPPPEDAPKTVEQLVLPLPAM